MIIIKPTPLGQGHIDSPLSVCTSAYFPAKYSVARNSKSTRARIIKLSINTAQHVNMCTRVLLTPPFIQGLKVTYFLVK